jgi:hypothetical protein
MILLVEPRTIMKLASFTRRLDRYQNHFAWRLVRALLKRTYKIEWPTSPFETVIKYDEGLTNASTRLMAEDKLLFFNSYKKAFGVLIPKIDVGTNIGAMTLKLPFAVGPGGNALAGAAS